MKEKVKFNYPDKSKFTVKDFKKGEFICINDKASKVYIRGEYDRELKKYHLIDTTDVWEMVDM